MHVAFFGVESTYFSSGMMNTIIMALPTCHHPQEEEEEEVGVEVILILLIIMAMKTITITMDMITTTTGVVMMTPTTAMKTSKGLEEDEQQEESVEV